MSSYHWHITYIVASRGKGLVVILSPFHKPKLSLEKKLLCGLVLSAASVPRSANLWGLSVGKGAWTMGILRMCLD